MMVAGSRKYDPFHKELWNNDKRHGQVAERGTPETVCVVVVFFSSSSFLTLFSVLNEIREFWLRADCTSWIPAGQEIDVYFSPRNPLR